ncbi:glycosyltransferase [Alkalicaulis satelles]|uniref:Glycosyltransferase n=1 Tax=Alkalicaulis satelles TaxID=2609175 RepID=A0A5M6ZLM0_9PROT|nr:glycosyltransferase [Alkalicaulis satelles]
MQDVALVTFAFVAVIVLALPELVQTGVLNLPVARDYVLFTADRVNVMLPVRSFILSFFLTYAIFAYGSRLTRMRLGGLFVLKFTLACAVIDGAAWASWRFVDAVWPIHFQQFLAGMAGLAIFPHTLISNARLPVDSGVANLRTGKIHEYAVLLIAAGIAAVIAIIVATVYADEAGYVRSIALLGGMGPGVFLAQQLMTGQLATIGWMRNMVSRRRAYAPPVTVLVPAHNEAHQIRETLLAVDAAAQRYDGPVRVVVMENCSTDATARLAETTLGGCLHLAGWTVDVSTIPGKAKALNRGLDLIEDEYVVRIDADTMIGPDAIRTAMRHFANSKVGGVGGLPLPQEDEGLLSKVRAIEVLLRHGFVQVSFGAFGGIFGLPGMFVIYRRRALDEAGGFTEGMNGEDTDITLAMTSLGWRMVSDPRAKFYTETPDTLAFLREQRTRWFRSLYHVTAHNRTALFRNGSIIGCVVLPFTLLNGARRAMMTPLLIYGLIVFFIFGGVYGHPDFATVVAVILGMPFILALTVLIVWRRFDLLWVLPLYMGFRFLRSYYTLGSTLSLIYPPRRAERAFQAPKPRQAPPFTG